MRATTATCQSLISIIIPQHGCWEQTLGCCDSLLRFHRESLELIVVDDGSSREQREKARRFLPASVRFLQQEHLGITVAWNRGLQAASGEVVVLLNNDVVTLKPWLQQLRDGLQTFPRGLMGAEWQTRRVMNSLRQKPGLPSAARRFLQGWCLGFRREHLAEMGLFDAAMRLYWSDTDWQYRWLQQFGKEGSALHVLPRGVMRHRGHVSTRKLKNRSSQWQQDRQVFLQKWTSANVPS